MTPSLMTATAQPGESGRSHLAKILSTFADRSGRLAGGPPAPGPAASSAATSTPGASQKSAFRMVIFSEVRTGSPSPLGGEGLGVRGSFSPLPSGEGRRSLLSLLSL